MNEGIGKTLCISLVAAFILGGIWTVHNNNEMDKKNWKLVATSLEDEKYYINKTKFNRTKDIAIVIVKEEDLVDSNYNYIKQIITFDCKANTIKERTIKYLGSERNRIVYSKKQEAISETSVYNSIKREACNLK